MELGMAPVNCLTDERTLYLLLKKLTDRSQIACHGRKAGWSITLEFCLWLVELKRMAVPATSPVLS